MNLIKRLILRLKIIVKSNKLAYAIITKTKLLKLYYSDYKKYSKSAFYINEKQSFENLIARITFYYHSIEKGLSYPNLKTGFGKKVIDKLLAALKEYKKSNYPKDNTRYQTGISTLNTYINLHRELGYDVEYLDKQLKDLNYELKKCIGGSTKYNGVDILKYKNGNFAMLATSRISVRNFGETPVKLDKINEAINIAMKTPSVCNRQPWNVYVIKNKTKISEILINQGGFKFENSNIDALIAVTANNFFMSSELERNQGFIDGGLFSMSLTYALEYLGVATCLLNAALTQVADKKIRNLLDVPYNENFVLFIALGSYPDNWSSPKSQRDSYLDITRYIL